MRAVFASIIASLKWLIGHWSRRVALVLLLMILMLAAFQRSLIYYPHRVDAVVPAEFGWSTDECQPLEVTTTDGLTLHGWRLQAKHRSSEEDLSPRPVVLYFCGNGGHRGYRQFSSRTLIALGCDVVIFDYRGYGDNAGSPAEAHLISDAKCIWEFLTQTLNIPARRIVLYGESLGGGVATALAAEFCRGGVEPGGLILQATFPSLAAAGEVHYPWLPVSWLLVDRFPSAERIVSVTCPILQIHGRRDTIVPWKLGEALFAVVPAHSSHGTPKVRLELPQTNHNDVYDLDSPDRSLLVDGLRKFLAALPH